MSTKVKTQLSGGKLPVSLHVRMYSVGTKDTALRHATANRYMVAYHPCSAIIL